MSLELPARPNLEHLKKQAKELLRNFGEGDAVARKLFREYASLPEDSLPKLADAQHVLARQYGFASWADLKQHVGSSASEEDPVAAIKAAVQANDAAKAAQILARHPALKARINDPWPGSAFGEMPLHIAVRRANREMIDLFLSAGADINKRSDWWAGGFSVLDDAWRQPWLPQFLLERGAKLDVHAASRLGMLDALKSLIGADPSLVHARGGDGQTPLHVARSVEIAQYLVERGADIDALDVDHESTPAQYLVRDAQDVARYLVRRGCRTDILMAAALGDLPLVRKHLDANPAAIRTPVSKEHFPMQNPRAGGTIYIWTLGQNKTAHLLAHEFHHLEVFQLLMDRSPEGLRLAMAYELGEEEIVRAILARNPAAAQSLDPDHQSRLVAAAMDSNAPAVRLMLAAGWPPGALDRGGVTALHWAGFHGNSEMARDILRYNPPLEASDNEFHATPLQWAIYGSVHGWYPQKGDYPATVEAILKAGAKLPSAEIPTEASQAVKDVLARLGFK